MTKYTLLALFPLLTLSSTAFATPSPMKRAAAPTAASTPNHKAKQKAAPSHAHASSRQSSLQAATHHPAPTK